MFENVSIPVNACPESGSILGTISLSADLDADLGCFAPRAHRIDQSAYDQTHAPNDFRSLALHELGHAVGLAHPPYDGTCPVMYVDVGCPVVIKRQLRADDIAGVVFLYDRIFSSGFE